MVLISEIHVIKGRVISSGGVLTVRRADIVSLQVSAAPVSRRVTGPIESWDNLRQLLVGQQIEIVRSDSITAIGSFVGVSSDGIAISGRGLTVTHPRHLVRRVHVLEGGREGGKTGLGLAAGAAIGFGVGMMIDCGRRTEQCSGLVALLMGMPIGAAVGALAGASTGRYPLMYRAPAGGVAAPNVATAEIAPNDSPPAAQAIPVVPADMWSNLQTLTARDRVEIRLQDGKTLKGFVADVSEAGLSVTNQESAARVSGELRLDRANIVRVHTLTPKSRAKPIIIMSLIGVAAAPAIDLLLDEMFVQPPISPPVTMLTFGAIGVLMGRGDKRVRVYDRAALGLRVSLSPIVGRRRQGLLMMVRF